jgi:hypothetical protein
MVNGNGLVLDGATHAAKAPQSDSQDTPGRCGAVLFSTLLFIYLFYFVMTVTARAGSFVRRPFASSIVIVPQHNSLSS